VDHPKRARLAAKKRVRLSGVLGKIAQLPREVKASCDGCGFASPWLATTTDRYGLPIHIAVCPRCALVSQVVRFTPESAASFYKWAVQAAGQCVPRRTDRRSVGGR